MKWHYKCGELWTLRNSVQKTKMFCLLVTRPDPFTPSFPLSSQFVSNRPSDLSIYLFLFHWPFHMLMFNYFNSLLIVLTQAAISFFFSQFYKNEVFISVFLEGNSKLSMSTNPLAQPPGCIEIMLSIKTHHIPMSLLRVFFWPFFPPLCISRF